MPNLPPNATSGTTIEEITEETTDPTIFEVSEEIRETTQKLDLSGTISDPEVEQEVILGRVGIPEEGTAEIAEEGIEEGIDLNLGILGIGVEMIPGIDQKGDQEEGVVEGVEEVEGAIRIEGMITEDSRIAEMITTLTGPTNQLQRVHHHQLLVNPGMMKELHLNPVRSSRTGMHLKNRTRLRIHPLRGLMLLLG